MNSARNIRYGKRLKMREVFEMKELILKTIIEGLGLGALLIMVCAVGIRRGAVGMVHLYSRAVQDRCEI